MTALESFARRHPALTYYALVFVISWGGILLVVGPGGIPGRPEQVATMMPVALVALFAGPCVAGLACTALVHGRMGLRDLVARGLRWRVGVRGYVVALLTAPLLVAGVLFGLSLISSEFLPGIVTTRDKAVLLVFAVGWGLVGGGLLEELGWTGFALPALRRRHGPLAAGLIVGFLWGVWHFLIAFWASGTSAGVLSPTLFLPALVFYVASLPAYRVLMVWLHDRTESLLLAMLMHASFSISMLILQPPSMDLRAGLTWNLVLAALLWTVVGVVALTGHGHLSRQPLTRPSLREATS
jgi:membrane protease YdiL (CAAX protease family)